MTTIECTQQFASLYDAVLLTVFFAVLAVGVALLLRKERRERLRLTDQPPQPRKRRT
jgi:hypothetical protein